MILEKYSMGVGDRFGHQAAAQLDALTKAKNDGLDIACVWNKSHREHTIIGSVPADVRREADCAIKTKSWAGAYYVDADHINLGNIDTFIECSDFFTIDVAKYISHELPADRIGEFTKAHTKLLGKLNLEGIDRQFDIIEEDLRRIAGKFLYAVKEAGRIYRHIVGIKGAGTFVTEVSMDESDEPQTPVELFVILAIIAAEGIPAQTIAPKFTGRFLKGIDYVGDAELFETQFNEDLAVISRAVKEFGLPENLKLSVHSGSDKFSIYPAIGRALRKFDAGIHIKTAGTTWLEEIIGLASAGGSGLEIACQVYKKSLDKFDELCAPYAAVIDIDKKNLPSPADVEKWDGQTFARTLRHDRRCPDYNLDFRQLLHVGYKIAAQMGPAFTDALKENAEIIAKNVTENIYERHIVPIFSPGSDL